jgi:hypothetical protein
MTRLTHAWRASGREQRLAALTALGLFVSMLFPWYSKTNTVVVRDAVHATQQSLSAFQAFSFVEAAVLLVSAAVLAMLFARAERRDFQLPGGDGTIVMIAGGWAALLIFYRLLDKPGLQGNQRITATVGVEWGIFIALLLALGLLYAGGRIRAHEHGQPAAERTRSRPGEPDPDERQTIRRPRRTENIVQPPSDEEEVATISTPPARGGRSAPVPARPRTPGTTPPATPPAPSTRRTPRGRPRYPPAPSEQMSFEDQPPSGE